MLVAPPEKEGETEMTRVPSTADRCRNLPPQCPWLMAIACLLLCHSVGMPSGPVAAAAESTAVGATIDARSVANLCEAADDPQQDLYPLMAAVVQSAGRPGKLVMVAFEDHELFAYAAAEEVTEATQATGAADQAQRSAQPGEAATAQKGNPSETAPQGRLLRRVIVLRPGAVLIGDELRSAAAKQSVSWQIVAERPGQLEKRDDRTRIALGKHELVCELLESGAAQSSTTGPGSSSRTAAAGSIGKLHLCYLSSLTPNAKLTAEQQTYRLSVTAAERVFTVMLPPLGVAAGKIGVADREGRQLLAERHLPAGLLPRGVTGRKLLERWDSAYRSGRPGWDTGRPSSELVQAVEEGTLKPCRVVELGCGTGTNAIFLASKGFDVTAIDIAPTALRLAEEKAGKAGVRVRWLLADVLLPPKLEPFDLVYDRGCYHGVRQQNAPRYVEALARLTRPGSQVLILAGNANEPRHYGPPRIKEEELRADFSKLFEFQWLRETRFDSADPQRPGALAWSVLLRRK
jgi:SAM-dependent methyltransferase